MIQEYPSKKFLYQMTLGPVSGFGQGAVDAASPKSSPNWSAIISRPLISEMVSRPTTGPAQGIDPHRHGPDGHCDGDTHGLVLDKVGSSRGQGS